MAKRLVNMPAGLSEAEQIGWLASWLTHQVGREAPLCMPQKGLQDGEGAVEAVVRMVLERNAEITRLRSVVLALEHELDLVYREAKEGRVQPYCPVIRCPVCGAPDVDYDGIGCFACFRDPTLCYCDHISSTDGVCDICGEPESRHELHEPKITNPWDSTS